MSSTWIKSRRHISSPCWRERIIDEPAATEPDCPEVEMPRGQMIALLRIRGGGKDSLFSKVLTCLMAVGSDDATQDDRYILASAGLITFDNATQNWKLLPRGLHKAEMIARDMARLYAVHHITFHFKQPRSNRGSFASCSCGGWHQTVTRKDGDDDRLRGYANAHLEAVARGTFKAPRPMEEFLNQYMPLRLPLGAADARGEG